jgi:predicted dehydrogenase
MGLRVAVIGVGHLGKEHARILSTLPDAELVGVADVNFEQAQAVAARCRTQAYSDYWPLLNLVDAACLVVPTTYHHSVALEFLRRGIHLLIEKPLATDLRQAEELAAAAHRHQALLQVGHIERFNPAFEELEQHSLQPKFIECERLGPYTGRSTDIGVVLDLMIHDLDLLLALVRAPVRSVDAVGVRIFGQHEDVANARLTFANGCVANVSASRASAAPVRRMRVWAPEGYASLDFARRHLTFVQPSAQLRLHGLDVRKLDPAGMARLKEELFGRHLEVQHLDRKDGDQLTRELQQFLHCVRTGSRPRVGGDDACAAMALANQVLEAIARHQWEGRADGPTGPLHVPVPLGPLFRAAEGGAAA